MDKETVEKIFELGADALYKTIDPSSGIVCKQSYSMLKDEAVKLFAIPDVVSTFTCYTCGNNEKEWSVKNKDWYCKRCKIICR